MASPDTFFSLKNASQEQFLTFDAQQARHLVLESDEGIISINFDTFWERFGVSWFPEVDNSAASRCILHRDAGGIVASSSFCI